MNLNELASAVEKEIGGSGDGIDIVTVKKVIKGLGCVLASLSVVAVFQVLARVAEVRSKD